MERVNVLKLASLCQRMPLDVYVVTTIGESPLEIRVVKSDFAETLREMDGRLGMHAEITLSGIHIYLD